MNRMIVRPQASKGGFRTIQSPRRIRPPSSAAQFNTFFRSWRRREAMKRHRWLGRAMKFQVTGIDAKSGEHRSIIVDPDSETNAAGAAKAKGVFASSIIRYVSPEVSAGNSRKTYGLVGGGCFVIGVFLGLAVSASLFWLCVLAILPLLAAVDWRDVARQQRIAERRERRRQSQLICPHCQQKGAVTTRSVTRKKGISGGKATAAVITGVLSVFVTGLSRKEAETEAKCGSKWYF